jgi:hypothetical protein
MERAVVVSVPDGNHEPAALLRDSFRAAKRARAGATLAAGAGAPRLLLRSCRVWDAAARCFTPPASVAVAGGCVLAVGRPGDGAALSEAGAAAVVDCRGLWLLPGLSDAHVHVTAVTADLAGLMSLPGGPGRRARGARGARRAPAPLPGADHSGLARERLPERSARRGPDSPLPTPHPKSRW